MSLLSWRTRQHLTQKQLAALVGVSRETVCKQERRGVTSRFFLLFAKRFPDDVREIMEESNGNSKQDVR